LRRGDDDEIGAELLEAVDNVLAPHLAFGVFALEAGRPDPHVDEHAAGLRERNESPAPPSSHDIDGREPVRCMRIADERD
jgi:hypothetical protein